MKTRQFSRKSIPFLFMIAVFFGSLQSLSFGQNAEITITPSPLSEETLDGSVVTLTPQGGRLFADNLKLDHGRGKYHRINNSVIFPPTSGIKITKATLAADRTQLELTLQFSGDLDANPTTLTIAVRGGIIENAQQANFPVTLSITTTQESLTATTSPTSLTEATLGGSEMTLTLQGRTFEDTQKIKDSASFSGIGGVTVGTVERLSDTQVKIGVQYSGDFDGNRTLTLRMIEDGIKNYSGASLIVEFPVTSVTESLTVATATPLTEATLDGSVVTLTLQGRTFENDLNGNMAVIGGGGVTKGTIERLNDTQVRMQLRFDGNLDGEGTITFPDGTVKGDDTLTFWVTGDGIKHYQGPDLTSNTLAVTAITESLSASTPAPLTEATLDGSVVTLTLHGRTFEANVGRFVSVSGISGVTLNTNGIRRVSDTQITVPLQFSGDFDSNGILRFTVNEQDINNYRCFPCTYTFSLHAELPVTAIVEPPTTTPSTTPVSEPTQPIGASLTATSTPTPLTEATLHNSTVTLTLQGRTFANNIDTIRGAVSTSGIFVILPADGFRRDSDTQITMRLAFNNDLSNNGTLTFRVAARGIQDYNGSDLTATVPVSANAESLTATPSSLTEAMLDGSLVRLTLHGRKFANNIEQYVTTPGLPGVRFSNINRVSDTEVSVRLAFNGNFDSDATLTFWINQGGIPSYPHVLTADLRVTATVAGTPQPPVVTTPQPTVVLIPDANLRAAVQQVIGNQITTDTMLNLTSLVANDRGIRDLTGLEYATNLSQLLLQNNSISNISALSGLTQMRELLLQSNSISDVSALAQMTQLWRLFLWDNNISNISALARMTQLTELNLGGNNISNISSLSGLTQLAHLDLPDNAILDIAPLARLTQLEWLEISDNSISDVSALAGLTQLTTLQLRANSISDISALSGLTQLTGLYLQKNPLNDAAISTHIPAIQANGTTVYFDNRVVTTPQPTVVLIPDANLRAAVQQVIGNQITTETMLNLTTLYPQSRGIINLTGLEYATNLIELRLNGNNISDISALAGLTQLTYLNIRDNNISDVSPLTRLTQLTTLIIYDNNISDISALAGLTQLTELNLSSNNISDISPLVGFTRLTDLYLTDNPLNTAAINTHIPAIQARGTTVYFDNRVVTTPQPTVVLIPDANLRAAVQQVIGNQITTDTMLNLTILNAHELGITNLTGLEHAINLTTLSLWGNNISDISALSSLTNLTELWLIDNTISNISPVTRLTNLTGLYLGDNSISDISPLVGNTGLGTGDTVDVRGNPLNTVSINTHIPTLQGRGVDVRFDAVVAQTVNIPDPNLRARIETALGKAAGATITTVDMEGLISLNAYSANISNLTGLEHATNLKWLYLAENNISDISAVTELTELMELRLYDNNISDISPVAGLTNLTELSLGDNNISDVSAVAGLMNLPELYLRDNNITDISAVRGLTNLTELFLGGNNISDISPVAGLTNLTGLYLRDNNITDISAVRGLTNLTELFLWGNTISDISAVTGLTNLTGLYLSDNTISDISAVAGLTNLTTLELGDNNMSDLSPLVANIGLGTGDIVYVKGNPLNAVSINTHIPTLQGRGVNVWFDAVVVQTVNIPDPNLRARIEAALGKRAGAAITTADMATLTTLDASGGPDMGMDDDMGMADDIIMDDIMMDDGMGIADDITDLTGLEHATNLTELYLGGNSISDISSVAGLTNLTDLYLWDNSISDLSPLVANAGLGKGDVIDVTGNPLNSLSINTHIPTLQGRGVEVLFDAVAPPLKGDVNEDGVVNILDLILAAQRLEQKGQNDADINGDGVVNILDLVLVSGAFGNTGAAPVLDPQVPTMPPLPTNTTVDVSPDSVQSASIGDQLTVSLKIVNGQNVAGYQATVTFDETALRYVSSANGDFLPAGGFFVRPVVEGNPIKLNAVSLAGESNGDGTLATLTFKVIAAKESTLTLSDVVLGNSAGEGFVPKIENIQITEPTRPKGKTLEIISGDDQEGLPGAALTHPFVVEILDGENRPVQGVEVTFSVSSGGGKLSTTSTTTDNNGQAGSTLTLGPNPGKNTVTVSVTGIQEERTFNAKGIRIPKAFWIISGHDQQGVTSEALAYPFVVEVRDQTGEPLGDVGVTFSVSSGGGTLSVTSATTDDKGRTESILTLGANPGTNTVTIAVTGIQEKQTVSAIAEIPSIPQDVNQDAEQQPTEASTTAATLSISPASVASPAIGEQLELSLNIAGGKAVAGYQATVQFDGTVLRYISSAVGDYLPAGAFSLPATESGNTVTLGATSLAGESAGGGTLATITFEVIAVRPSTVTLSDVLLTDKVGTPTAPGIENAEITTSPGLPEDVNEDGIVNIIDLALVASNFGIQGTNAADVNGDGIVNIIDLTLVAAAFGNTAAAPGIWNIRLDGMPARSDVEAWLRDARQVNLSDPTFQRGILFIEKLLTALTPKETALLPNYPNPFNPETWIPYQLSEDGPVSVSIYDTTGVLVRTLSLGMQSAGFYNSRGRAAYWDGRNSQGELVVSGTYFYRLSTPSFHQTRRLVIIK